MMKTDIELYAKEGGETREPQGNKIRQTFRKLGLRQMERNIKEGKHTGKIKI